ncbi:MAG: protoheme IX farnesyltransferase [Acidobacteria bacterium RIFCSPLOWO2_02_FULL_61_28]|nr:MAG: protoheme IX farnesyltransferase [Acidobacteria bacterium RIFCSPLOWO2_02_FULL_61_28]
MSLTGAAIQAAVAPASFKLADYAELTKPRVTSLILMSTLVGFYLGTAAELNFFLLLHTLLGTALVASGTAALNQFWEREPDGKMLRTRDRPLPARRMQPWKALCFGVALAVAGVLYLYVTANPLTSLLAALTLVTYLFLYTPLKKRTPLCTLVGSFPGAIPPLIGWVAARGEITVAAGILYLILFLWQFPHFLSIAWLYREDYERGGIRMLPVVEPDGKETGRQIVLYCVALLPVSLLPSLLGVTGWVYFGGALVLGIGFLHYGARAAMGRTKMQARRLLQASVIYLPLVYGLMMIDKTVP